MKDIIDNKLRNKNQFFLCQQGCRFVLGGASWLDRYWSMGGARPRPSTSHQRGFKKQTTKACLEYLKNQAFPYQHNTARGRPWNVQIQTRDFKGPSVHNRKLIRILSFCPSDQAPTTVLGRSTLTKKSCCTLSLYPPLSVFSSSFSELARAGIEPRTFRSAVLNAIHQTMTTYKWLSH